MSLNRIVESKPISRDLAFVGRTSNQANYPNWGMEKPARRSPMKLPYRGSEVPFDGRTSYGDTYQPTERALAFKAKQSQQLN